MPLLSDSGKRPKTMEARHQALAATVVDRVCDDIPWALTQVVSSNAVTSRVEGNDNFREHERNRQ